MAFSPALLQPPRTNETQNDKTPRLFKLGDVSPYAAFGRWPIRVYPLCGASIAGPATPRFVGAAHTRWGDMSPQPPRNAHALLCG